MLDPAGLAPTAAPSHRILDALRNDGARLVSEHPSEQSRGSDTFFDANGKPVETIRCLVESDGPGLRANRNAQGGYHVGRRTLVSVNGAAAIPFERFCLDQNGLSKAEKRILLADLIAYGAHSDPDAGLTVSVIPAPDRAMSEARVAAETELACLDALTCQLAEARRRYATDTACNAWSLEQATEDVARAAEATARAFAARAELA